MAPRLVRAGRQREHEQRFHQIIAPLIVRMVLCGLSRHKVALRGESIHESPCQCPTQSPTGSSKRTAIIMHP